MINLVPLTSRSFSCKSSELWQLKLIVFWHLLLKLVKLLLWKQKYF